MADPLLQRIAREDAASAARDDRIREAANGAALALQARPIIQIIELRGSPGVENLDRAEGEYAGGVTILLRVPGAETAHRLRFDGTVIDQLHELLHSDPLPADDEPAELLTETVA